MINKKLYGLPDSTLAYDRTENAAFMVWFPEREYIVCGRSNKAENTVNTDAAYRRNIQIVQRPSGGETVFLSPNTLVISVKLPNEKALNMNDFFRKINGAVIRALKNCGAKNLSERGISDIAIGQMKILGSAMHRKPKTVFYHGVLNVAEPVESFDALLKHPSREPNYRQGRSHKAFVTSLKAAGYLWEPQSVKAALEKELKKLTQSADDLKNPESEFIGSKK